MRAALLLGGASLLLAGCAVGPDRPPPRPAPPPEFLADYRPPAGEARLWWRGFQDPALDALVAQALSDNFTIAAARSRFAAATALARAERADRFPSLDGFVTGETARDGGGGSETVGTIGLAGILLPDLFGRLSREAEEAAAEADAAAYFAADVRRLVAAAVALQYVELKRTQARLELLDESTGLQEQTLRVVQLRHEAGLSSNLDVRRAAADLARTRAQRGLLEIAQAEAANRLAVLIGDSPGSEPVAKAFGAEIPEFAGGPPRGVPADLVRRRPDLLAVEADLAAATARIGVETADLFPSLRIPGQVTAERGSSGAVVSSFVASLAATLDVPIFDAGRRRAEVRAAEAEAAARFADYRQALLDILGEVETALVSVASQTARRNELAASVRESQAAFRQSDALYREGLASLFDLLDAQRQLISSREAHVDSRAEVASAIIAMYSAVGAPTETDGPPAG